MGLDETDPTVTVVWLAVYKQFMEAIDGIDNGVRARASLRCSFPHRS